MTHPLILAYGETTEKEFPLILFIGRETNNGTTSDGSIGLFDFKLFPHCAFWNMAFKVFGAYNNLETYQVKDLFAKAKSAPIIFTDAYSKGIVNEVVDKYKERSTLTKGDFESQIDAVFKHDELMKRVKLIITSGLSNNIYTSFKVGLSAKAIEASIPTIDISFLYGTNYPKIKVEIGAKEISIIQQVFKEYMHVNSLVHT